MTQLPYPDDFDSEFEPLYAIPFDDGLPPPMTLSVWPFFRSVDLFPIRELAGNIVIERTGCEP